MRRNSMMPGTPREESISFHNCFGKGNFIVTTTTTKVSGCDSVELLLRCGEGDRPSWPPTLASSVNIA